MISPLLVFLVMLWLATLWFYYTELFGAGYAPTADKSVEKMIEFAKLNKKKVVYDLGCGNGKIVGRAAKFCKRAIGVEIEPLRVLISKFVTRKQKNVKIVEKNLFSCDLRDADVVFIFLKQRTNNKLKEKFLEEMKPGSMVISHYWTLNMPVWKKDEKLRVYAYKIK